MRRQYLGCNKCKKKSNSFMNYQEKIELQYYEYIDTEYIYSRLFER